jgi:hypothetical protein
MTSIRSMADDYHALTGESAYMGLSQGFHRFVDGTVRVGDDAARDRMARLLDDARRLTPAGHHWTRPLGDSRVYLVNDATGLIDHSRTVAATEHPWREGE